MRDYLIRHALEHVWCSPRQDSQAIIGPKRISKPEGVHTSVRHGWRTLPLPTREKFHVYQIGQIHPSLLGLFPRRKVWITLSEMMGVEKLIADVYTTNGKMLPRFNVWFVVTEDGTLILAVCDQPRIANLKTEDVFIRLYSNTFFSSDRADAATEEIRCEGIRVTTPEAALLFQRRIRDLQNRRGLTNIYVNGVFVNDYVPSLLNPGDVIEYVYDSTVKRVIDFPISSLDQFDSLLDLKRKYLLHYAGPQVGGEMIDYRDDIDVYLIKTAMVNDRLTWDGVLFHKNLNDAFRMVTHRDYSVSIPNVNAYLGARPGWTDAAQLTLRLHIRHSGYARPLMDEHHRIKDLYRLGEHDLRMAMLGTEASVGVWHAQNLEASFYPKVMDGYRENITFNDVQYAYGYNAIGKLIADSPLPVENDHGRPVVYLPQSLQLDSTIYEYDAQGVLLGWFWHQAGAEYTPQLTNTRLIEGRVGKGKFKISTEFQARQTLMEAGVNYRFYVCPIRSGVAQYDEWMDVTGDEDFYVVDSDRRATWLVDFEDYVVAVKNDKDFLAYDLSLSPSNGLLKFTIDGVLNHETTLQGVCGISPGVIEIWLNGRALIEGLDYFGKGLQFVITNKKYLVPGNTQKVTIRASGFCQTNMTREAPNEAGFIRYGQLSRNSRYNTRDDKVMRIVADGRTFLRSALKFVETDAALTVEDVPNGSPYVIDDVIVPMRNLTNGEDTYSFRQKSLLVDKAVEDYLTLKLPEPSKPNPDAILDKYSIYSPFASTVMYDLINGVLSMDEFKGHYSELDVREVLAPYTYLLDFDPTQKSIDLDYVSIHPHNLNVETVLDIYQYQFLERAIKIYLDDKVDLTRFVRLKPGYI